MTSSPWFPTSRMSRALTATCAFLGALACIASAAAQASGNPALNVGSVQVSATSQTYSLSVTFASNATLGSIAVLTNGATGLDFADAGTGTCVTNTAYAVNQTCSVNVVFTPRFAGSRTGAVVLNDNSGNVIATGYLQGTGIGPQVSFLPGTESVIPGSSVSNPHGIAVDGNGNIYVSDGNGLEKEAYSNGSYTQSTILGGLTGLDLLAVDGAGNVYVTDTGNMRVLKETPGPDGYSQSVVDSGFGYPYGVAVDGAGNVYISGYNNSGTGFVLEETPTAGNSYTRSTVASGMSIAGAVAVDGGGNLYIAESTGVVKETLAQGVYTQSGPPFGIASANAVAVDGTGNVYLTDSSTYNVYKETPTPSGYVQSAVVTDLHKILGPWGVAVDGTGMMYIAYLGGNSLVKADFADAPTLNFASTTVGATSSDSPQTVTLQNIGNADLTLPIPATGNNPSIASDFSLDSNAASACPITDSGASTPGTVPGGTACELAISFSPTAPGSIIGSLTLTDNNLNAPLPGYATQSITLNGTATQPVTPVITWPTPAPITWNTPLSAAQLDATTNVAGTFVYSPSLGSVLTAGPHTLTVTFTPTDTTDYTTATASVILTVNKATPVITWPAPAPITYGTPLSATQLDATASVPGTFTYTPAVGFVPPVGTDTLTVVFTPTDTTDYNSTSASVNLTVKPAPGFTLSTSPSSLTVKQGNSASTTISVADVGGFTGKVSLSASGLPSGVSASFSKNPTTGSSTLTLSAGNKAATGTNTITITGTSGTLRQTTTINLTVDSRK